MRPLLAVLALGACSPEPETDAPTWHRDVAPIAQRHCMGCHTTGGIAPFSMEDYATVAIMGPLMVQEVEAGRMPPWGAEETDECQPRYGWKEDLRLSDEEKAILSAWNDAGRPEGDPADAPELDLPEPPGPPDLEIEPSVPWTTGGDADQFRCFVLDPGNATQDLWVNAWQLAAGNSAVVHHALVFLDREGQSLEYADVGDSYECFGSANLDSNELIGAWAPGGVRTQMPPDTATRIPAGATLVMQIHYHPKPGANEPDATRFQLWTQDAPPAWESQIQLIGNFEPGDELGELLAGPNDADGPEFRVPAGATGHTETMRIDLPSYIPEMRVWAVASHMHYVGTDMKITVDRREPRTGEPDTECLLQTPHWDFDWQRGYAYDADLDDVPRLRRGDRLDLRCTYDNTTDNPAVRRALDEAGLDAPVDVHLGESTLEEMCLGAFVYATPYRPDSEK